MMVLTSCAVGPDFHSPAAPKVTRYTEKPLAKQTAGINGVGSAGNAQMFAMNQTIPAQWWTLFRSQTLNYLITTGLNNNPSVTAAQETLKQAQETFNAQVGTSFYPAVTADGGFTRQRLAGANFGSSSTLGGNAFNVYNTSVDVSYTFDVFGSARRQVEASGAQVDYQRFELEATYLTLTSNIVTTAINIASLQAQIQATNELIQAQQTTLNILQKQFNLGGASASDLLAQQSQLAQTRANLPPLEKSLAQARHALAVLVGAFPENKQPEIRLDQLYLPLKLPVSLPSALVQQRPDVRAAEALMHAASARIGVATANLLPQFTLSGSYGTSANIPSGLGAPANLAWNLGGQLLQPIFKGGSLLANRRASVAAYKAAAAQYRQTVLQAFQNVADSLRAIETDAQALRTQLQAETAAHKSLEIAQQQYRLGGVSYLTLLTAQKDYQQIRVMRIQAQAQRYADTAALFQALGGGWWNVGNTK
jgi:NodT family efflux transporter outer membrane factor (OMF) lipoprotein